MQQLVLWEMNKLPLCGLFDSITHEYLVISDLQGYFDNFRFPRIFIGQDFYFSYL
jgi:hypothetical protein